MYRFLSALVAMLMLVLAAGCTSGAGAMLDTLRGGVASATGAEFRTKPRVSYLRVGTPEGATAYLVLGALDAHPEGQLFVWLSGDGVVIKLQDGRLFSTAGLTEGDWREVRRPRLPAWQEIPAEGLRYQREVDAMPGYRFGRVQTLQLRPIAADPTIALRDVKAGDLNWFEEVELGEHPGKLPAARYAVDFRQKPAEVVYSEQCLSPDLCFTFEPWLAYAESGSTSK